MKILAIETSCDETAASVVEKTQQDVRVLSNVVASQINIHRKFGGIFPEHASRAHAEKIIPVVQEALLQSEANAFQSKSRRRAARLKASRALRPDFLAGKIKAGTLKALASDLDVIAVTTGSGLIGSLLIGVNFAKTYSYANNLPIIGINHLLGHIYSCFAETDVIHRDLGVINSDSLSDNKSPNYFQPRAEGANHPLPSFPALFLIVSGGHTGIYLMKSHKNIKTLGETLDDAAGEAFDKVAKLLQLGYPGGPAIAEAAAKLKIQSAKCKMKMQNVKLPRSMLNRKDYNFSFSGLKTAVLYKYKKVINRDLGVISSDSLSDNKSPNHNKSRPFGANHISAALAAEFQQAVIDILIGKTIQAAYQFRPKSICLCGGVSANKELREQMKKAVSGLPWKVSYHIPPIELTTDNAAMIGIATAYHLDQKTKWDKINADPNLRL